MMHKLAPFFDAVLALKIVKRAGWVAKAGIKDAESVADHTFSMCVIGMALSDIMSLDTKKVVRMVLLHDLAESMVGDSMPGQVSARKKMQQENHPPTPLFAAPPPPRPHRPEAPRWRSACARPAPGCANGGDRPARRRPAGAGHEHLDMRPDAPREQGRERDQGGHNHRWQVRRQHPPDYCRDRAYPSAPRRSKCESRA